MSGVEPRPPPVPLRPEGLLAQPGVGLLHGDVPGDPAADLRRRSSATRRSSRAAGSRRRPTTCRRSSPSRSISATMQSLAMSLVDRPRGRPPQARPRHADAGLGLHRRPGRQLDRRLAADAGADRPAIGRLLYGVAIPWDAAARRSLVTLAIGAAAFCCLGIALTAAIPSEDAAAPIANVVPAAALLPLRRLHPRDRDPRRRARRRRRLPDPPFLRGLLRRLRPAGAAAPAFEWGDLAVVAAWGVAGLVLAIRYFRWTPRRG